MKNTFLLVALCLVLLPATIFAQTYTDFSIGTSNQDNFFFSLSAKKQLNSRLRLGVEYQFGSPQKRFIEAQEINEGYANTISLPFTYSLSTRHPINLHLFVRPGLRFQGIIDPDDNDRRDSMMRSTAILIEAGLLVSAQLSDKLLLQSGVTFPTIFEVNPSQLFENNATVVHAGLSYQQSERSVLFTKTLMGPAFGASGDSQKFMWSIQAGVRFNFGAATHAQALLIEPSF